MYIVMWDYSTLFAIRLFSTPARWRCIKQYMRKRHKPVFSLLSFSTVVGTGLLGPQRTTCHIQKILVPVRKKSNSCNHNNIISDNLSHKYLPLTQENIPFQQMSQRRYKLKIPVTEYCTTYELPCR